MPQTFIPSVVRATLIGITPDLTQLLNVFHFSVPAAPVTLADCTVIANLVKDWVASDYTSLCPGTIQFQAVHVRSMEGLIVPEYTLYDGSVGDLIGDTMPYHTSLYVNFNTGLTGRKNRGGVHMFPTTETFNGPSGQPTAAYVTAVETAIGNFRAAVLASDYTWVVASFTHQSYEPVISFVVDSAWGSVVSRKVGHGR